MARVVHAAPGLSAMTFATNSEDGARIAYDLVGEGAPLLLFHATLTSGALWRTLGYVDALRAEHQLILVDARGHGRSDKPTTEDAYAMERLVGDVIAVLDQDRRLTLGKREQATGNLESDVHLQPG